MTSYVDREKERRNEKSMSTCAYLIIFLEKKKKKNDDGFKETQLSKFNPKKLREIEIVERVSKDRRHKHKETGYEKRKGEKVRENSKCEGKGFYR